MVEKLYLISLLTFITCFQVSGQANQNINDSNCIKKFKILPLPTFGYTPETRFYFGGVALFMYSFYPDSNSRLSNAKIEITISTNKQLLLELGWNHFFRQEKWFSPGTFHISRYPDVYYGIGSQVDDSAKVTFNSNRIIFQTSLLKKVKDQAFIGPVFRYVNYNSLKFINGSESSFSEMQASSLAGIGLSLLWDKRNNLLNATSGFYRELTLTANFNENSIYCKAIFDLRYYKSVNVNIIVFRFLNENIFGNPPFYDYCFLGGDKISRGYFYGQLRDQNLMNMQAEYRLKVIGRFGVALFSGIAILYDDFDEIYDENLKPNVGAGVRFKIDRKNDINLRLDYAVGLDRSSGFYIAFGESF